MRYLALSILAALIVVSTIPLVLSYEFSDAEFTVPSWIKNNAGWWADEQIDDDSFISGIQWLVTNDVIILPSIEQGTGDDENVIPRWIKSTAGWWAEDKINDATFIGAIKYLINEGIMVVMEPEVVEETSTDIEEIVEMNGFDFIVNDHNCALCTNWGYTGTQYYFQIKTFDEHRGSPIDGVTINAKIISKGGELRHDFGALTTEDGIYNGNITIPGGTEWFGENILSVTAEYNGIEKTIEKEFDVFYKKNAGSSCYNHSPLDITSQDTQPQGIAFNSDGRKLFIMGSHGDKVIEYALAIAYCLDNLQYIRSFSVTSQEVLPTSVAFNADGTKMFTLGYTTGKKVYEYTLSTGFDVSTASYASDEFTVTTQDNKPQEIAFNDDGTKMFMVGDQKDKVWEYTLSTGFDVSTATGVDDFSIAGQETFVGGMAFNDDGTKMFVVGRDADAVFEYTLSTGFDVSSSSYVDSFSIADDEDQATGIAFNSAGTRMFIVGANGDEINVYNLSTGFDISTAR